MVRKVIYSSYTATLGIEATWPYKVGGHSRGDPENHNNKTDDVRTLRTVLLKAYLEHQGSFHVEMVPDNVVYVFLEVLFFWKYLPGIWVDT